MILFLDFDGVLHPAIAREETVFCCLPHLWSIMRARPAVQVVLSTSWREQFDPDEMLDIVTSNGAEDLRDRFIGSTPILAGHPREAECHAWLAENGHTDRPWLALDDDPTQFTDPIHLYLVDRHTGLTAADVQNILAVIG